jgi:lysozyme
VSVIDIMPRLLATLRAEEGTVLAVYDDATSKPIVPGSHVVGHPTIGTGRCLSSRNGITDLEAYVLLQNDCERVFASLDDKLPWWRQMTPARQVVLAGMAFQMGIIGLLAFKRTLAAMERGDYATAAQGMIVSLWAQQTPARAGRMATLMRQG